MLRDEFKSLVASMVQDTDGNLSPEEQDVAIDLALARYDQDEPNDIPVDVTAPGGNSLNLPTAYVPGFSKLRAIESPPDQVPPRFMNRTAFALYATPLGDRLIFASELSDGQELRLHLTVPHVMTTEGTSVPPHRIEAVACWAAALLLDQLSWSSGPSLLSAFSSPSLPMIWVPFRRFRVSGVRRSNMVTARRMVRGWRGILQCL